MKSSLGKFQSYDEKPPEKFVPKIQQKPRLIKTKPQEITEVEKTGAAILDSLFKPLSERQAPSAPQPHLSPLEIIREEKQARQQVEQAEAPTPGRKQRQAPASKVTPIRKTKAATKAKQKAVKVATVVDERPMPPADEFRDDELRDWLQFWYSIFGTHKACAKAAGLKPATWFSIYAHCVNGKDYGSRPGRRVSAPALGIDIENLYVSKRR